MESLDELLADLHSATSTMKTEQQAAQSNSTHSSSSSGSLPSQVYQARLSPNRSNGSDQLSGLSPRNLYSNDHKFMSQQRYNSSGDGLNSSSMSRRDSDRYSASSTGSGDTPAPPLPPPPSRDVIEEATAGYSSEPLYEPQNVVHMTRDNPYISNHTTTQARTQYIPSSSDVGVSHTALGANLNELDYLLQDLNSTQFMEEISRSASDNSVNSLQSPNSNTRLPPPTLPKPTQKSQLRSPNVSVTFDVADGKHARDDSQTSGDFAAGVHASSATRELEELMDSLSQFKVTTNTQSSPGDDEPAYAKVDKSASNPTSPDKSQSKPSELDNMLGNLESDMRGHGVSVSTKGLCGACSKPIVGQVITALARIWHPEHFCCHSCKEELGTKSFFERDEMPYCEPCYHRLFAPLCGKCNTHILDKCVTAMDTTWHMECFACEHCGRMLNDEGFHERDGRPYCRNDYFEIFAPKCGGCRLPIIEDFISTLNTHWHTQCFRCMECGVTLAGGSFYDHDGQPYCETHYYAKRGSLCAGCQKPITGRCITAMSRKFHPEHFTCAFCLKQLNKGTFKEQNDKPYCHPCFVKLFG